MCIFQDFPVELTKGLTKPEPENPRIGEFYFSTETAIDGLKTLNCKV